MKLHVRKHTLYRKKCALEKVMNNGSVFAIPQLKLDHSTNMMFRHPTYYELCSVNIDEVTNLLIVNNFS